MYKCTVFDGRRQIEAFDVGISGHSACCLDRCNHSVVAIQFVDAGGANFTDYLNY